MSMQWMHGVHWCSYVRQAKATSISVHDRQMCEALRHGQRRRRDGWADSAQRWRELGGATVADDLGADE